MWLCLEESSSSVRVEGDTSSWFQVITDVRQGCILSPLQFAITTDWVLRTTAENGAVGIGQEMHTFAT